jgi:hypothetical protein
MEQSNLAKRFYKVAEEQNNLAMEQSKVAKRFITL